MSNAIFTAENVTKQYASTKALDAVSFEVAPQRIFGLLGPNGAGKTSLIRIINQITEADSGRILIDGEELSPKHIEDIGYLPEERGLYKKMKVGEQALYLAQLKGMSKNDAKRQLKEWFDKFDIGQWWGKKVEELSKGMAQKVQFITTVLHKPKILILDEPFSGFDPVNAQIIKEEILSLKDNGASIFLSTHDMPSVEQICDEIVLINKGKKVLGGEINEVRKSHSPNTYDVEFKGNMMAFGNLLWTDFELLEKEALAESVVRARIDFGGSTVNTLLERMLSDFEIRGVKQVIPTMNEIFIGAVGEKEE